MLSLRFSLRVGGGGRLYDVGAIVWWAEDPVLLGEKIFLHLELVAESVREELEQEVRECRDLDR